MAKILKKPDLNSNFRESWKNEEKFYIALAENMQEILEQIILSKAISIDELRLKSKEAERLLYRVRKRFRSWITANVPKIYQKTVRSYVTSENLLKAKKSKTIGPLSVDRLLKQGLTDMNRAALEGKKNIENLINVVFERNITATKQNIIDEVTVNIKAAKSADSAKLVGKSELYKELVANSIDGKFLKVKGKDGKTRNYKIKSYANLVARTKYVEAHTEAILDVARANDTDLVQCSSHNTTTPYDKQFEGKVFSISGKNKKFPILIDRPPFHPNCLHFLNPIFIDAYSDSELNDLARKSKMPKKMIKPNGKNPRSRANGG